MGKTVESYRMVHVEGFEKALRNEDREAPEEQPDACRDLASAESGLFDNPKIVSFKST